MTYLVPYGDYSLLITHYSLLIFVVLSSFVISFLSKLPEETYFLSLQNSQQYNNFSELKLAEITKRLNIKKGDNNYFSCSTLSIILQNINLNIFTDEELLDVVRLNWQKLYWIKELKFVKGANRNSFNYLKEIKFDNQDLFSEIDYQSIERQYLNCMNRKSTYNKDDLKELIFNL